jgi:uncharacterized delta-60 repeat protein
MTKRSSTRLLLQASLLVLVAAGFVAARAAAQVGFADTTFGYGGVSMANFDLTSQGLDEAFATAVTPDNKIVVVGKAQNGSCFELAVAQILPNGFFDTSFGPNHDGRFVFQYPGACTTIGFAVAIDNVVPSLNLYEIVVAANVQTPSDAAFPERVIVMRVNSAGADPLFGDHKPQGYQEVLVARGASNNVNIGTGLAIDSSHRILVTGTAQGPSDIEGFMVRLQTEGAFDTTYGGAGVSIYTFGDGNTFPVGMALAADGSTFVGGNTSGGFMGIAKIDPTGSFDSSFGGSGFVTYSSLGTPAITSMALDSSGLISLGGVVSSLSEAIVHRFNPDSTPESVQTFHFSNAPGDTSTVASMTVQADGSLLVAGQHNQILSDANGNGAGVARLTGHPLVLDPFFGNNGVYVLDPRLNAATAITPHAVTQDQNGELVVVGSALNERTNPSNYDMFVERLHATAFNSCAGSQTEACLVGGRFKVAVSWKEANGQAGSGNLTSFGSDNSALFFFFDPSNYEMLIKVLNGCGVDNKYWVFYSATTNVGFTVTVTDTLHGVVKTYSNKVNVVAPPVTDTSAFDCP